MDRSISGERFSVIYRIYGGQKESLSAAKDICIEQTVEFPEDLISDDFIRNNVFGRIESFDAVNETLYRASISFAVEISSFEFTQFINVIFGNISLKPGIFIEQIILPDNFIKYFKGPRFGIEGIRKILNVYNKPLVASAVKPMGMSAVQLAETAYKFALGGIHIIKDDHSLADQNFAGFKDRVKACSDAVAEANEKTGAVSLYFPNITAPFNEIIKRAEFVKTTGVRGVLISPAITGYDCMKFIAENDGLDLIIMSHPAFAGSYLSGVSGFTHGALLGQLARLAGADITVYPNFGGRFSFTKEQCSDIVKSSYAEMHHIKKIFPAPGGGMNFSNIPEMTEFYGNDVIYLMGGGLFKRSGDLTQNCRELISLINR